MTFWSGAGVVLQPLLSVANRVKAIKMQPQPVKLPVVVKPQQPSSAQHIDEIVEKLDKAKLRWVEVSPIERADYVKDCIPSTIALTEEMAKESAVAKGSYGSGVGEEWLSLMSIVFGMKDYEDALRANGSPKPNRVYTHKNGQKVAEVFPIGPVGLLFGGFRGEVWIRPGKEATQGEVYRNKDAGNKSPGGVTLVLGGGNQASVVALDILHKLLVDDEVVVAKMNPVNDYLGPLFAKAFKPFIDLGVLEFVYGGIDEAKHLISHPLITSIHLTGAEDTFNAIAWGSPSAERKGTPVVTKTLHGELGNITPFIIVPGPWTEDDMHYHAEQIIAGKAQNCGHNCCALEVLILPEHWSQRDQFLKILKHHFNNTPQRFPYYPRSMDNWKKFKAAMPQAAELGQPVDAPPDALFKPVPFLFAEGLKPEQALARNEKWSLAFQEVVLPYDEMDVPGYLKAAAKFANDGLWGSLCCSVFIHPNTESKHKDAFEDFISDLKFGSVNINCPTHLGYSIPGLPWGAHPDKGNTLEDIGSGNCYVHNTMLYDHVDKGVLRAAWRYNPTPFWNVNNTCLEKLTPLALKVLQKRDNYFLALGYILRCAAVAIRG